MARKRMVPRVKPATLIKGIVSVSILSYAALKIDKSTIELFFASRPFIQVALIVVVLFLHIYLLAWRWALLASSHTRHVDIAFSTHILRYIDSGIYNLFTPGNIGGDAYKVTYLKRSGLQVSSSVSLVLCERYLGLMTYACSGMLLLPFLGVFTSKSGLILVSIASLTVLLLGMKTLYVLTDSFLHESRLSLSSGNLLSKPLNLLKKLLLSVSSAANIFHSHPQRFQIAALSLLSLALWPLCFYVLLISNNPHLDFLSLSAAAIATELVRILPISLGGLGIREATFAYFMQELGASYDSCFLGALFLYTMLMVSIIAMSSFAKLIFLKRGSI